MGLNLGLIVTKIVNRVLIKRGRKAMWELDQNSRRAVALSE